MVVELPLVGLIIVCVWTYIMGAILGAEIMKEYLREFGE